MMIIGYPSRNGPLKSGGEYGPDPWRSLAIPDISGSVSALATDCHRSLSVIKSSNKGMPYERLLLEGVFQGVNNDPAG
jgi:hypothetical protein